MKKFSYRLNREHAGVLSLAVANLSQRGDGHPTAYRNAPKFGFIGGLKPSKNFREGHVHVQNVPNSDCVVNPHSVSDADYVEVMRRESNYSKKILWRNIQLAMHVKYGKENITRLAKEAGVGHGTIQRIKAAETSIGIEILDRLADVFHVEPWHLLVPTFDPNNPPVVHLSATERDFYERMREAARKLLNSSK